MKLRRRRGLGGRRGRGTDTDPSGGGAGGSRAPRPGAAGDWGDRVLRAGHWLLGRRGRWARTGIVVLACFGVGYFLAATVLFPAPEEATPVEQVRVPEAVGQPLEAAVRRAAERGLELVATTAIDHPRAEAGVVVAQSPLAGQRAAVGDTVRVATSLGTRTARVPPLRGLSASQATTILERLGFTVRLREVEAASPGVQETEPAAGTRLDLPAEVEVRVGEGSRVVAVPDLRGMHIDDVETLLEEAGLQLGSVRYDPDAAQAPGRVVGQSPPPGYSLRGGGFVSVEVAGRPRGG